MKVHRPSNSNLPLYVAWIAVLAITLGISLFYHSENTVFSGIAETREIVLNSETPVDIRKINVTEGQSVNKGDLLVELSSPDMVLKINHIEHQLDELKARNGIDKAGIKSRIEQLTAEKAAKENEITAQISELENQYSINKNLVSDLKSLAGETASYAEDERSPVKLRIKNLKKELSLSVNPLQVQIDLLRKTLNNSEAPVEIQVERYEKELDLLKKANSRLNLYAQISGVIGSVFFKAGEKVSPFAPIVTLHSRTPSFVKGYIYENSIANIRIGNKVTVASNSGSEGMVSGEVVGIGSRIVEYPVRLRKHPDIQVWGREVMIKIPESNHFILGEKVSISSDSENRGLVGRIRGVLSASESIADTSCRTAKRSTELGQYNKISEKKIEASGILFLNDLGKYLVVSDDTEDAKPILYLVDSSGNVTDDLLIEGADKIDDLESITEGENGMIYLASSLSANSKGKVKDKRKRLLSVFRDGENLSLVRSVDLYSALKDCAEKNNEVEWAVFILEGLSNESIDLEGMFYKDGALFLSFKAPLADGKSLILKLSDIDGFMHSGTLEKEQVSIWKKIGLQCEDMTEPELISDICFSSSGIFATGTSKSENGSERSGSLWRIDETTGTAARIMIFNGRAPEGVSASKTGDSLLLCFDGGGKNKSEIVQVSMSSVAGNS